MSRDSAAPSDSLPPMRREPVVDLRSLDEGIAVLTRFEEMLAQLEDALDAMSLQHR